MDRRTPIQELHKIFFSPTSFSISTNVFESSLALPNVEMRRNSSHIEISISGTKNLLITVPLSVEGVENMRVNAARIKRLDVEMMTNYNLYTAHFTPTYGIGCSILADVAIQELPPHFVTLDKAVSEGRYNRATIRQAVETLKETLQSKKIYFTDAEALAAESIILGEDGLLYPIRYPYLRIYGEVEDGDAAIDALRDWVEINCDATPDLEHQPSEKAEYKPRNWEHFEGHLYAGEMNEERAMIEDISGWGFVDSENNIVVAPHYKKAFPYGEGRAIVLSESGWGLINLYGDEVIPSIYDSLGYNVSTSLSCAKKGNRWAYFSYLGEQLTPFKFEYPDEDITMEELQKLR